MNETFGSETSHAWPGAKEILLILLFWTVLAAFSAVNRQIDRPRGAIHLRASAPVIMAFAEAYSWAVLTPLVFWLTSRYGVDRSNWVRRGLLFVGLGIVCALVVNLVLDLTRAQLLPLWMTGRRGFRPGGGMPMHGRGSPLWFLNEMTIYLGVLAAGIARDYVYRERARREETAALEVQLSRARLDALRMQLNPHFLFNTLHAISALVERDPAGVRTMIARLSDLLRYALDQAEEAEVPLDKELAFIRGYLDIMAIRFQGRLEIEWTIERGVGRTMVPSLILQPLVENSIKHGVSRGEGVGRIEIGARISGSSLLLIVRDEGGEVTGEGREEPSGLGLKNTRERLLRMYGEEASLRLAAIEGGGTEAIVQIPYRERSE